MEYIIEKLRQTQTATPSELDEEDREQIYLGIEGEKLKLEHLPPIEVISSSVLEKDLEGITTFIRQTIPS